MNPMDEFYKRKKNYQGVILLTEKGFPICQLKVGKNNIGDNIVEIRLYNDTFNHINSADREEILYMIESYISDQRDKIKEFIIKRLKEKMEYAREEILKDFKLIGSIEKSD